VTLSIDRNLCSAFLATGIDGVSRDGVSGFAARQHSYRRSGVREFKVFESLQLWAKMPIAIVGEFSPQPRKIPRRVSLHRAGILRVSAEQRWRWFCSIS
jgi:hypothetical protein